MASARKFGTVNAALFSSELTCRRSTAMHRADRHRETTKITKKV